MLTRTRDFFFFAIFPPPLIFCPSLPFFLLFVVVDFFILKSFFLRLFLGIRRCSRHLRHHAAFPFPFLPNQLE